MVGTTPTIGAMMAPAAPARAAPRPKVSMNMIWGYVGIMSFGQTAFFGVGAYTYGAIGLNLIARTGDTHWALVGGLGAATALAAVVGYFMLCGRVSDVYAAQTWAQVDWAGGFVRLEPGTTKNREGRAFPIIPALRAILERRVEYTRG